jgi:hypothetical protein
MNDVVVKKTVPNALHSEPFSRLDINFTLEASFLDTAV